MEAGNQILPVTQSRNLHFDGHVPRGANQFLTPFEDLHDPQKYTAVHPSRLHPRGLHVCNVYNGLGSASGIQVDTVESHAVQRAAAHNAEARGTVFLASEHSAKCTPTAERLFVPSSPKGVVALYSVYTV